MRRTQFELDKMWDLWGKPVNLDKARNRTSHQDSEHFDWKKENKIQISHISGSCSKVTKLHQLAYRPAVNRKVRVMILNNNQPSGDMKFWINSVTVSRGKVEINLEYQEYTIKQRTQQWKWLIRVTTMVKCLFSFSADSMKLWVFVSCTVTLFSFVILPLDGIRTRSKRKLQNNLQVL